MEKPGRYKKRKPTNMVVLIRVRQGKNETLWAYIDRFTKVGVDIGGSDESLKCWILRKVLRPDCTFLGEIREKGSPQPEGLNT